MLFRFILVLSCVLAPSLFSKALVFGVVPQQSPLELKRDWEPFINYLKEATGLDIVFKTERSIPEFERVLSSGGYDIAYMNPSHYVMVHKTQGYNAIVRSEKELVGILVVRKDSPIKNISQLQGKNFLFPSAGAFAATVIAKYELMNDHGIDLEKDKNYRYVNSHDSVYKGVARGLGDVGGGIERTYNDLNDPETKNQLMILHKTVAYPSHPFAIKREVPNALQGKIIQALLETPESLRKPLKLKRLAETSDKEYESVRKMSKFFPKMGE